MARLRRKLARLAVFYVWIILHKSASRKKKREKEKEWEDERRCSRSTSDFAGRLTAAKVLLMKERAVVFFDELVADV